jgi:hypothetical protein
MAENSQNTGATRAQAALLLAHARAQSNDIQRALGALATGSALHARLAALALQLSGATHALSLALNGPAFSLSQADLTALSGIVNADEITALLTEAAVQTAASGAGAQSLAAVSAATRQEVQTLASDIFGRRIFDPYLHFGTAGDEEEFRRREAGRRAYIDAQLARHTPEGELNAGGGMLGYMLDAHAHGAGGSPEFMPRWNALADRLQCQRAAMHAAGQSTGAFDRDLTASVRGFLKAKGLPDAGIDARLAGSASPLDAVRPFLKDDHASRQLENRMELTVAPTAPFPPLPRAGMTGDGEAPAAPLTIDPEAMRARLKAAGILTVSSAEPVSGHGLSVQKPAGKAGPGVAG